MPDAAVQYMTAVEQHASQPTRAGLFQDQVERRMYLVKYDQAAAIAGEGDGFFSPGLVEELVLSATLALPNIEVSATSEFYVFRGDWHPTKYDPSTEPGQPAAGKYMRLASISCDLYRGNPRIVQVVLEWRPVYTPYEPLWTIQWELEIERSRFDIWLKPIVGPNGGPVEIERRFPVRVDTAKVRYHDLTSVDDDGNALININAINAAVGSLHGIPWVSPENPEGEGNGGDDPPLPPEPPAPWRGIGANGYWLFEGFSVEPVDDGHVNLEFRFVGKGIQYGAEPDPGASMIGLWNAAFKQPGSVGMPAKVISREMYRWMDFHTLGLNDDPLPWIQPPIP